MLVLIIIAVIIFVVVSTLSLCKVAGETDRQYEVMYMRYMKEKEHEAAQQAASTAIAIHEG